MASILLIEDTTAFSAYVQKCLAGHTVTWVKNLNEAQVALSVGRYHVVLLDLGLPDSPDPRWTWETLKDAIGDTPCIIVTGNPTTKTGDTVKIIGKDPLWQDETLLAAEIERLIASHGGGGHG